GRSGRQGDPGESRFYLSMTDELMRRFNANAAQRIMNNPSMPEDMALESKIVSRAIETAQGQVESTNAEQRKNVLKYDDVMNRQREAIYGDRRRILEGGDLQEQVQHFLEDAIKAMVSEATSSGHGDDWDFKQLWTNLGQLYPIALTIEEVLEEGGGPGRITPEFLYEEILSDARVQYEERERAIGAENLRELERRVVLSVIGRKWQEHLYEMDYLKEGIGLRAMAQRDPLVEYQREGYVMFQTMMEAIREESVGFLFNLEVEVAAPTPVSLPGVTDGRSNTTTPVLNTPGLDAPAPPSTLQYTSPSEDGEAESRVERSASAAAKTKGKANRAERRSKKAKRS
ncbi:MAG: preprotein translocase subunit SecA, partial [Micrococcaceae bacterium]|nr:preprotein translocase subunit SecA [Micrococcaceae bacterium]